MRFETRAFFQAFLLLLTLILVPLQAAAETPARKSVLYPYDNSLGQKMRWTGAYARFSVEAPKDIFGFRIHVSRYNSEDEKGLEVKIQANGEMIDILHFFEATEKDLFWTMPTADHQLEIEIEVSRTFQPQHMGAANTYSDLGVAISEVHFFDELPGGKIGFEGSDVSTEGPAWSKKKPITFHWTRLRASWQPACSPDEWLAFYIACGHPDVPTHAVRVKLLGDGKELRNWTIQNGDWVPVLLKPAETRGLRHLTLQSDRVFNERLHFPGGDPRDLSIAVAPMKHVPDPPKEALGFYLWEASKEILGKDQPYRWTGKMAVAPIRGQHKEFLVMAVMAGEPDLSTHPVEVLLRPNRGKEQKITLHNSMWQPVSFPLADLNKSSTVMEIEVSRTWCPKAAGVGGDGRDIGVAVSKMVFADQENLPAWEGFYHWKNTPKGFVVEGAGTDIRYRWSSAYGVIRRQFKAGDWLFIMCAHPDIATHPVHVKILGDGKLLAEETLTDNEFHRVLLRAHELSDAREVRVEVDRTYNPKKSGISKDNRDLGVAVAIIPASADN